MIIKSQKTDLKRSIDKVKDSMSSKATMDILKGIYFNGKTMKTTDLEVSTEVNLTDYNITVAGNIQIIFPKEFIDIVDKLPVGLVEIDIDEDTFKAEIKASGSKFKISCWNGEEFPSLPEVESEEIEVSSQDLKRALEKARISVSTDSTQPALTGIQIESNGKKTYLTSTNTYKLSNVELKDLGLPEGTKLIIPEVAARQIVNHCSEVETVKVVTIDGFIKFIFDDVTFISRTIEGNYPNWRQVIKNDSNTRIEVDRVNLLEAVKRVNIIARQESSVVSLKVDTNELIIESPNTTDEGIDTVECKLEGDSKQIALDANYLIDFLKVLDEDVVVLELKDSLSPLFIKEGNARFLVMPIRPNA